MNARQGAGRAQACLARPAGLLTAASRDSPRPPVLPSSHSGNIVTSVRSDVPHFKNRGDTIWNSWTAYSSCLLGPGEQRVPRGVSATSHPGMLRVLVSTMGREAEMAVRAGGQGTGVQSSVCS